MTKFERIDDSKAIIVQKPKERKTILLGIILSVCLCFGIFYLMRTVESTSARLLGGKYIVYSPVDGVVFDLPVDPQSAIRVGDALLRFDPSGIRRKNAQVREYMAFFQQNRNNPNMLRQKFQSLFSEIFGSFNQQRQGYIDQEEAALAEYKKKTIEHAKLKVQMRDKRNHDANGLPSAELVAKEKAMRLELETDFANLEKIHQSRASVDAQMRSATHELSQPHGPLYIYLEEQQKKVQKLVEHEYLYAEHVGKVGEFFVKKGDVVKEKDALFEVWPEASGQWWVVAEFAAKDTADFKLRDICTVITEDGTEFEARIESMKPKGEVVDVRLVVQQAPEGLKPDAFVKVVK